MRIAVMTFRLRASWVHSLKEKRMIVKSLTAKLQNRFHVSAAETDEQDTHQIIVIGIEYLIKSKSISLVARRTFPVMLLITTPPLIVTFLLNELSEIAFKTMS